ncbi:MAG: type II secretion system F family protein [Candidatus Sumerlaeia bacterium]|nr:type II secretion system F family protein [Candidatus Sumerlaeia bacterium]
MAEFYYKAITAEGEEVTGTLVAPHRRMALQSLASKGLTATDLSEVDQARAGGSLLERLLALGRDKAPRVKGTEVTEMTRQLATMINSDVTLIDALSVIYEQAESEAVKQVVGKLRDAVKGGENLSTAMEAQPGTFSPLYTSMVKVGETGGMLGDVLNQMADLLEAEQEVKGEVRAALAYPLIVLLLGVATVVLIFTFVMPRILKIFEGVEAALPLPTQILMQSGAFMREHWWHIGLGIVLIVVVVAQLLRTERGRLVWDKVRLRLPLIGPLVRKAAIARFSRCLGALVHGGVPLLEGLESVSALLNNRVMSRLIDQAMASIKDGRSFADSLRGNDLFPAMVTHMVGVGEKTGKLDNMLMRIAETYERQTRTLIRVLISMLAPMLIICIATMVAFIALALLLPIFKMNQLMR